MLKVLYLLNFAGRADIERYVEALTKYLAADRPIQLFLAYNGGGLLVRRLETMGVSCHRTRMCRRFDKKAAYELAELYAEQDIDLVHCHYPREYCIALPAKECNKKVCMVYTNRFVLTNDFVACFSNHIMDRQQDQMIAVRNEGEKQFVANGWSADHVRVILNAVGLDAWAGSRNQSILRAELGLDGSRFVTLYASWFAADKGRKHLADSVERLIELCATPSALVLVRDGPLLEPTKVQVQKLRPGDYVKLIGFHEGIKNLYKGSGLYVDPSQHEALSFLIIKTVAIGLSVIATDTGGNSDIVSNEVECGMLVGYDSPGSMAVAMRCFLEDLTFVARCRENARRTTEGGFEIHKMARATYGAYRKALHD